MLYFCRIDLPYTDLQTSFDVISAEAESIVVYEHNENVKNIHCHFLINWKSTDATLKNRFKSNVDPGKLGTGNAFWCFQTTYDKPSKPCDHGAITYMSKGRLEPVLVKGFTQDEIREYKDKWVERTPETSRKYQAKLQYVVRETPNQAKKRKNELVTEMISRIDANQQTHIIREIIEVLNENHIVFSRYTVRDYYDTIVSRKYTDSFVVNMERFCNYNT